MIPNPLKSACLPWIVAAAWALAPITARAAVAVTVEGRDQLVLVGPSNISNTNLNRARIDRRDLEPGSLGELMAPLIVSSLDACGASGIKAVGLHPSEVKDRIGETNSRYGGLGIYANLASDDRNSQGNWFIAPFFAFEGTVTMDDGTAEPIELFNVNRILLASSDRTTQEDFFRARTVDVEESLKKFLAASLPQAVRAALSAHCAQRRP
ncbi:MAG TPA: hypothetical protein VN598_16955 [Usitatibacter sp.]|nr:hypothetical protein [Usitatibacter sp.]